MTRLTEALERARAAGAAGEKAAEPAAPPAESSQGDVPQAWHFDAELGDVVASDEPVPVPVPAPPPPAAEKPELRVVASSAPAAAPQAEPAVQADSQYPFAVGPIAAMLVVGQSPDSTLLEQYRHLAAALHHSQLRNGIRTVMVTSAVESEGKTTTAANLALTLSHSYQRQVLLIDADLRRPSVHRLFQLNNQAGLTDVLKTASQNAPLPLHVVSPTLSVMTAGRPDQDPMSGLVSDTMRDFLAEAAEQFDWVVVDTPPVALLTDANLLAAMIDQAVLVVGAASTPYPLVRRAIEAVGPSRILGVVLNRVKRADLAIGYGYGYYGYGYGYSYGRNDVQKKRRFLAFGRKKS